MTPAALKLRMAIAEAGKAKPRNKYGARKTPCSCGRTHDSAREAARCGELHLLLRAGEIAQLEQQRFFPFVISGIALRHPGGRAAGVTIDFTYLENGQRIAEDSKGHRVRDWPLRRAIF